MAKPVTVKHLQGIAASKVQAVTFPLFCGIISLLPTKKGGGITSFLTPQKQMGNLFSTEIVLSLQVLWASLLPLP